MIGFKALRLLNQSEVELKSHVDCTSDCRQFPVLSALWMCFLWVLTGLVGSVYYLHLVAWLTRVIIWKKLFTRYNYVWLWRCSKTGATRWSCWRSESFEMFYLRELINSWPSVEIHIQRPSLCPVQLPFSSKSIQKEASSPISLQEGRGLAQVGRYPAVFCKLGKKWSWHLHSSSSL